MILSNKTMQDFVLHIISTKKKVVAYAAGNIGMCVVPPLFKAYGIDSYVDFYVDADKNKQGIEVDLYEHTVTVNPISELTRVTEKHVILITNMYFYPIIEMLDGMDWLNNVEVYVFPIMQMTQNAKNEDSTIQVSDYPLIPKTIHYCWFSNTTMPIQMKECIESWKKFCPGYEIIEWNETNYDVAKYDYTKYAYEHGAWSFLSDCARMDILYQEGGIYLDTDVELIKNIDPLLYVPAFISCERFGQVNSGGGMGAQKGNPILRSMLEYRLNQPSPYENSEYSFRTNCYYETKPLLLEGLVPNNTTQVLKDIVVYSSEFFHPLDYITEKVNITSNTYAIHRFRGSWLDGAYRDDRINTQTRYQEVLDRMKNSSSL